MGLVFSNVYVFLLLSLNLTHKHCNTKCIYTITHFYYVRKLRNNIFLLNI